MNNLIYVTKKHNTKKYYAFFFRQKLQKNAKKYGERIIGNVSKWLKNAQKMSDPLTEGAFCSIIEALLNFEIY